MSEEKNSINGIKMEKARWRNRRWMAWASLTSMILITLALLFTNWCPESRLTIVKEVITWYYFVSASIIGAYMGVTTWAHIKGRRG
jgi:hypothetical protein